MPSEELPWDRASVPITTAGHYVRNPLMSHTGPAHFPAPSPSLEKACTVESYQGSSQAPFI